MLTRRSAGSAKWCIPWMTFRGNHGCLRDSVRGLVALLATPFLLLVTLGIALWVVALHKMRGGIFESARRRSRWWLVVDIAAAVLGVGALDLLVDAF